MLKNASCVRNQAGFCRRPATALVAIFIVGASALDLRAQDFFYQAYERGVRAYESGDLETARRLLERALTMEPRQSRSKIFYGTMRQVYLPEYYLALICAKEKQFDKARAYKQSLEQQGLIKPGQREYAALETALAGAVVSNKPEQPPVTVPKGPEPSTTPRGGTAPQPADPRPAPPTPEPGGSKQPGPTKPETTKENKPETKPDPPRPEPRPEQPPNKPDTPPSTTGNPRPTPNPPPPNPPPPDPTPPKPNPAAELQRISDDVDKLLNSGAFDRAWSAAQKAAAFPGGKESAANLATRVRERIARTAEARLRDNDVANATRLAETLDRIAPGSPESARIRRMMDERREYAGIERESFRNLLLGDYRKVVELTAPLVEGGRASGRMLFYAACSRAGLSLMAQDRDREALEEEARRLFDAATKASPYFTKEEPYISPEILGLLRRR